MLYDELKEKISQLLSFRTDIYKLLMKFDLYQDMYPELKLTNEGIVKFLRALKHGNNNLSYKDIFNVERQPYEVESTIDIKTPGIAFLTL